MHGKLGVLTLVPQPRPLIDWASGILHDGGYTYIYGKSNHDMYAAPRGRDQLDGTVELLRRTWLDADPASAVSIEHIYTLLHLQRDQGGWRLHVHRQPLPVDNQVDAAFGCSPIGPI